MLLIRLKSSNVKFEHKLEDNKVVLVMFFENFQSWGKTMKDIIFHFRFFYLSKEDEFRKAKERWVLETREYLSTSKGAYQIAYDYALIFTQSPTVNLFLASDPNPEASSLEDLQYVGLILRIIGELVVTPKILPTDIEFGNQETIIERLSDYWSGTVGLYGPSSFSQPSIGETFIYAPIPLPTADSSIMILFGIDDLVPESAKLLKNILSSFIYERLRIDMNYSYSSEVGILSGKYLYILTDAEVTPDLSQNALLSIIEEAPSHIDKMHIDEWAELVQNQYESELGRFEFYSSKAGKSSVISILKKYILEHAFHGRRIIIQLWGRGTDIARESNLAEMQKLSNPSTKIFTSISEFPPDKKVPEHLKSGLIESVERKSSQDDKPSSRPLPLRGMLHTIVRDMPYL